MHLRKTTLLHGGWDIRCPIRQKSGKNSRKDLPAIPPETLRVTMWAGLRVGMHVSHCVLRIAMQAGAKPQR
jgi:hypothetical protein